MEKTYLIFSSYFSLLEIFIEKLFQRDPRHIKPNSTLPHSLFEIS